MRRLISDCDIVLSKAARRAKIKNGEWWDKANRDEEVNNVEDSPALAAAKKENEELKPEMEKATKMIEEMREERKKAE